MTRLNIAIVVTCVFPCTSIRIDQTIQTWILCIPPTSVTIAYADTAGLALTKSNEARQWLQTICTDTGAYYCDASSAVQDVSGALLQEFASANGVTLNSSGLNQIIQYLRYHAVS